jgi:putative addiction module component (TIGR02574 family)
MDSSPSIFDLGIDRWSVDDRLRLIGEICDSLPPESLDEIPEWHKEILDQRLAEAEANPQSFIPWKEALEKLLGRL